MNRSIILIFVIIFSINGCNYNYKESVFTGTAGQTRSKSAGKEVSEKTNIHYNAKYCLECHETRPVQGKEKYLRYGGDFKQLCRCHYESDQFHTHPVNFIPSETLKEKIPKYFPLQDGKVSCTTCHDIVVQCHDSQEDKILRKGQMLLRGAPHKTRTSMCFQCHDIEKYRKFNPHKQLNEKKEVMKEKCLYCHSIAPDEKQTTYEDAKLIGNFGALCMGCHYQTAKQPLHARHLRTPSAGVLSQINRLQAQLKIVLPLDEDGKVTCVTCHNPHQKGLIPDQRVGAKGAGEIHRHRLIDNMCIKCHPMR